MSNNQAQKKIICIVGTTASGKTKLAVELARKLNGEIVSADSRQVYKYMDVGTGKDLREFKVESRKLKGNRNKYLSIPYHCIDIVDPKTDYSLAKWLKAAKKAIAEIQGRGRVPIVVGGTHFYVQALVEGYDLADVKPDKELRKHLEKLNAKQLFTRLKKLDSEYASKLNNSERNNKQRLVRRLEILAKNKKGIRSKGLGIKDKNKYLLIGLTWSAKELKKRIKKRLLERLENENMVGEVKRLHEKHRVSWKRLESFGLEYRYVSLYSRGKMTYDAMVEELARAIYQFSRRQMSWLRRWERQGGKIFWLKNTKDAMKVVNG